MARNTKPLFDLLGFLLLAATSISASGRLSADEPPPARFRESVAIETNLTAQRQLELAHVHLAEKRWKEGVDLIRQVTANDSGSLVAIGPGRYLNVSVYAQLLLAALPPEGLVVARNSFDDSAREAVSEAIRNRNDAALRAIVRDSFIARAADEAMLTLGQWAWETGDFTQARGWWERQLPLGIPVAPGTALPVLRYPDTQYERPELLARLVMCSIVAGNGGQAAFERNVFRGRYPEAQGELGGRKGKLADRLDEIARQARGWSFPPRDTAVSTFGTNTARNGVLPQEIDVGAERWSAELSADPFTPGAAFRTANNRSALSLFPVTFGNILLVSTADQILAWNLRTGKAAWPDAQNENPAIYPTVPEATPDFSALQVTGSPRYTLTVSDGRLYARLGAVTARSRDDIRESDSQLVCLDLEHGEGKLVWKTDAASLDPQLAFEGSPLVMQGRAYVAARKGRPQMQTEVFCLDADTGHRLWDRPVCAAVANPIAGEAVLSHHLLTAGDDAVFLCTGTGAVAALETIGGALRWVVTYESTQQEDGALPSRNEKVTGPCLFAQNIVVAAPSDFDGILAIDSRTGTTLWRRTLPGGIDHLLGSKDGILIASGESLWGIELMNGHVIWHLGFADPGSHGYGRGILAADVVYWPTREEIFVVDQASGELRRRIPLLARYTQSGGNLILAGDSLVVAQPQRITVFGTQAGRGRRANLGFTQTQPATGILRRVAERHTAAAR